MREELLFGTFCAILLTAIVLLVYYVHDESRPVWTFRVATYTDGFTHAQMYTIVEVLTQGDEILDVRRKWSVNCENLSDLARESHLIAEALHKPFIELEDYL